MNTICNYSFSTRHHKLGNAYSKITVFVNITIPLDDLPKCRVEVEFAIWSRW